MNHVNPNAARMYMLREQGKSFREIASITGQTRGAVAGWIKRNRDAPPPPKLEHIPPSLPIEHDGFIRPPTKAQLMSRR
jgi:transcriptional regulator with XRE-family HTH domain